MISINRIQPLVSVCIVTYNQEKYIRKCLESVVTQHADFPIEIIVGDDASTDSTSMILNEFSVAHPNRFRIIRHKKNIGPTANVLSTYGVAKGKYIAHLDGDDIMLPGKLQAQLDILEANPDCIACVHDVILINPSDELIQDHWKNNKEGKKDVHYLLDNLPFFAHSSKFFRAESLHGFTGDGKGELIDCTLHYIQAKRGFFYYIDSPLGGYRLLTGLTSGTGTVNPVIVRRICEVYEKALVELPKKRRTEKAYAKALLGFAYQSAVLGNGLDFRKYIKRSVEVAKISALQLAMYLMYFVPGLACRIAGLRSSFRPGGRYRR